MQGASIRACRLRAPTLRKKKLLILPNDSQGIIYLTQGRSCRTFRTACGGVLLESSRQVDCLQSLLIDPVGEL